MTQQRDGQRTLPRREPVTVTARRYLPAVARCARGAARRDVSRHPGRRALVRGDTNTPTRRRPMQVGHRQRAGPYNSTTASASVTLPAADLALQKTLNAPIVPGTPSPGRSSLEPRAVVATGSPSLTPSPPPRPPSAGPVGRGAVRRHRAELERAHLHLAESLPAGSRTRAQVTATLHVGDASSQHRGCLEHVGQFDPNTSTTRARDLHPTPESNLVITKSTAATSWRARKEATHSR